MYHFCRMDISKSIRTVREEKRLTQLEVADKLQMERSNYARLEARGEKLSIEQLESIAEALGVSLFALLGQDEEIDNLLNEKEKLEEEINNIIEAKLLLENYIERSFNLFLKQVEKDKGLENGILYAFFKQHEGDRDKFIAGNTFREILRENRMFLICTIGSCFIHPYHDFLVREMYEFMKPYSDFEEELLVKYRIKLKIQNERQKLKNG